MSMHLKLARPIKTPFNPGFKHKNLVPIVLGVFSTIAVLALLNAQLISAQMRYNFFPPKPVSVSATSLPIKAPESGEWLNIPKLGIKAPIKEVESFAEWEVDIALRGGVVHYNGTANPGQAGNVVIFGHSSGPPWSPGKFNFVFTLLGKLKTGDKIMLDYKGTRYIYQMVSSTVVSPSDMSPLNPSSTPQLTLITCTPVGTSKNRLVVRAEQISPKPTTATRIQPDSDLNLPKQLPSD